MIKKSVFEEELISGMHHQLVKQATQQDCDNLEQAVDYLNSAAEIFENLGMSKNAEQIVSILEKIANKAHDPRKVSDRHTKGLTPERMVKNLKNHGHPMNLSDDGVDDLLNADVEDTLEVSDGDVGVELHDFEEERDLPFVKNLSASASQRTIEQCMQDEEDGWGKCLDYDYKGTTLLGNVETACPRCLEELSKHDQKKKEKLTEQKKKKDEKLQKELNMMIRNRKMY